MTPAERRIRCIALLAKMDQVIAECESLLSELVLEGDEVVYVTVKLDLRRQWPERVERMLETPSRQRLKFRHRRAWSSYGTRNAMYGDMSLSAYESALVRLLAEIDQRVANDEDAAFIAELTLEQRKKAVARLDFSRSAGERVERMLNAHDSSQER